jgi:hypothetical protein
LLSFAPDQWDSVKKFGQFRYQPLEGNRLFARGISATSDHLEKFRVLVEVANDLSDGFEIDRKELDENGYSPAKYSKQFSAVAECCIIELYSALDGIRDVVFAVYSSVQGVQKKSTSKLFSKAKNNEYSAEFPDELNVLLSVAYDDWFLELRRYRTEFTHGSLGSCHKDVETGKISYMHSGLGGNGRSLIIEDFASYISGVYENVLTLQHHVFEFFYKTLPLEPVDVLCGFYTGRAYMRTINPETPLTRDSGTCKSSHYEIQCPIREHCGAYKNSVEKT